MADNLISIVLPVYGQADHIGEVVQEYEEALGRVRYAHETILAVNGNADGSLRACQAVAEHVPNVKVLHSPTAGWGRAVRMGLAEARGDILCYTNSARTSPSDLMLLLLYAVVYPSVVVKANRR